MDSPSEDLWNSLLILAYYNYAVDHKKSMLGQSNDNNKE
jgi:hypothetical protein